VRGGRPTSARDRYENTAEARISVAATGPPYKAPALPIFHVVECTYLGSAGWAVGRRGCPLPRKPRSRPSTAGTSARGSGSAGVCTRCPARNAGTCRPRHLIRAIHHIGRQNFDLLCVSNVQRGYLTTH
jgi:hypothetical protein